MATRTDTHRKGAIIPAAYKYVFSYSLATSQQGWPIPAWKVNCEIDRRKETLGADGRLVSVENGQHDPDGRCCIVGLRSVAKAKFAEYGSTGRCTACGAAFIYGDVWQHTTGEYIHLGHDCAEKYGLLADRSAFELARGRAKAAAAVQLQRHVNEEQRKAFLADHPGLEQALETDHRISRDLKAKFLQYKSLSPRQIELAFKLQADVERQKNQPAEALVPAPIQDGRRQTIEGEVVSVKGHEGAFGFSVKVTVKIKTPAGNWLCWGTLPSNLNNVKRGAVIRFNARLKAGNDAHFAFFSRPSQAEEVNAAVAG